MYAIDFDNTNNRHLGKMLQLQAQHNGDTEFLITDEQRISFAEAEQLANRLAAGFAAQGIERGDRVVFFMANLPEMVLMALALNKLGAIWIPICTDYKGEWLADTIKRSRGKMLITDSEHIDKLAQIIDQLDPQGYVVVDPQNTNTVIPNAVAYNDLLAEQPYQSDYDSMDYGDTCAILWTSGTTGRSKGVMQSHNCWIRCILLGQSLQHKTRTGDIAYCALPLYNSGAWLTCVIRALAQGIGVVIEKKFSVNNFMARIKHFNATQTFAVGAMGVFLMNQPERDDDADNPLREAGIVPMAPDMWPKFEKRFGLEILTVGIGMSECLLMLNQMHSDVKVPVYSLGFAVPDVEIMLCDDEGNEVPAGEAGEICVKPLAPHILLNGYFDDEVATANAYRGEWFLTGDMARKDPENGAHYFVDRKKDVVRFAGRNISTLEVESVANRHPAIEQVAAFGIASELLDSEDELKLNIVLAQGQTLSAEEVCQFLNDNAPHYFVPRYIDFVDALPYTPTNKVEKYKLRQQGISEQTWDLKTSSYQVSK